LNPWPLGPVASTLTTTPCTYGAITKVYMGHGDKVPSLLNLDTSPHTLVILLPRSASKGLLEPSEMVWMWWWWHNSYPCWEFNTSHSAHK
jgi:hypothetical protein